MSRRGRFDEDEDDESPPWLAPAVPDHRRATVVSSRKFSLWVLLLAGLFLLVVGLIYAQIAKPDDGAPVYADADGEVPLIRAPDSPFKVRPKDPGGLDLEGNTQSAYEAAGGLDPGGELNFDALPEEPIDRSQLAAAAQRPAPAPAANAPVDLLPPVAKAPEAAKPAPAPPAAAEAKTPPKNEAKEPIAAEATGNFALQLGAFSSEAKANAAWKSFAGRYSYLADLEKSVIPLERDGTKLFRLRATGVGSRAEADNLCARLRVAGDQCSVVD